MEKVECRESYDLLLAVCRLNDIELTIGYKQLRDMLERLCRTQMQNEGLQMTDLSARISFVAAKMGLSVVEQNRLHTFRLTSNAILNRVEQPTREHLMRDAKTLAFFVRKMYDEDIPTALYQLLPRADATYIVAPPAVRKEKRMRVCFQYSDEQYLYVTPLDELSDEDKLTVSRARKIQRFLSQPFHVAEQFTGIPGVLVDIKDTIKGFNMIIDGELDHLPEAAFNLKGTIEDVIEAGQKMLAEA